MEKKHGALEKYVRGGSPEERSALLCRLMGWFRLQPDSEFWTAIEQLTMLERAVQDVETAQLDAESKRLLSERTAVHTLELDDLEPAPEVSEATELLRDLVCSAEWFLEQGASKTSERNAEGDEVYRRNRADLERYLEDAKEFIRQQDRQSPEPGQALIF